MDAVNMRRASPPELLNTRSIYRGQDLRSIAVRALPARTGRPGRRAEAPTPAACTRKSTSFSVITPSALASIHSNTPSRYSAASIRSSMLPS
jgi:hypothetical protein